MELKDGVLSTSALKCFSGEFDIESIHTLNLKAQNISDLGNLGECTGLERLDLSKNDVTKLYSLAGLTNLNYLNLSMNRITSLEGLQSLDNLISLNLAGNLIGSVDTLRCLEGLEKLEELRLKDEIHVLSNPVCMNTSYKTDVIYLLPALKILDGERVRGQGSDVYSLCNEIDKAVDEKERTTDRAIRPVSEPWIPDGFWHDKTAAQYETAGLDNCEKQLIDLLDECHDLVQKTSKKLDSVTNSTYLTEPDPASINS